jgi:hypothetical protein
MIRTADGRQITDLTITYAVAAYSGGLILSNQFTSTGPTYAGPAFRKADWALLQKAEKAKAAYGVAIRQYTRWYKASRFALVNNTASAKRIDQMIGWMDAANARANTAEAKLAALGIEQF